MKRISNRALALLLIVALILGGTGWYLKDYVNNGASWALYFSRENSNSGGELLDRNGILLASYDASGARFSADEEIRKACYHITGDYWGRTGTGLLTRRLSGSDNFDLVKGTTQTEFCSSRLTVDSSMCTAALRALGEDRKGCLMVMNYRTGEILCMVSTPTLDPIDGDAELTEGVFINRCLSAVYTPGSCFKLVTAAAALETVPDMLTRTFYCEKEYEIAGVAISCTGTHYTQTLEQALANSCNCAFAQITVKVGQENMINYVTQYGFLDNLQLDGITTAAGTYPLEFVGDPELAWSGIGQSTDQICPYAMLRYVAAIANGGILAEPHLIASGEETTTTRLIRSDTAATLRQMMLNNVVSHYAPDTNFPGLTLGAKTGTAELGDGDTHAWFTGFLEDENHPYAFVALVERGGSGLKTAGAVVNQVFQECILSAN